MSQQTVGFIDYVAQGGDTFDSIALVAYNEERMASTIIEANPDLSDVLIFEGGEAVRPGSPDGKRGAHYAYICYL